MVGITEKRSPIANKRKKLFWTNLFQSLQQEINFGERERERERERGGGGGGKEFVERDIKNIVYL